METQTIRRPHLISEAQGDLFKFQAQVDEFRKNNKVVEEHFSFSMFPIQAPKSSFIQGVGQMVNVQMQLIPVCYMVVEEPAQKEKQSPLKILS